MQKAKRRDYNKNRLLCPAFALPSDRSDRINYRIIHTRHPLRGTPECGRGGREGFFLKARDDVRIVMSNRLVVKLSPAARSHSNSCITVARTRAATGIRCIVRGVVVETAVVLVCARHAARNQIMLCAVTHTFVIRFEFSTSNR